VQLGNPRVTNLSFSGATVEFPLTVTNRNSFPLPVADVAGSLSVAGATLGSLSTGDLGALPAKGTRQLSVPLQVSFLSAAGAAVTAIRGGNAEVRFSAEVTSGEGRVPLQVDQLVTFLK
jgi:LEA14-like dessication related protein